MTIGEQILWVSDLPNSGPKMQVINSLRLLEKQMTGKAGDFCIVTMDIKDYEAFEEFKQFKKFFNKK